MKLKGHQKFWLLILIPLIGSFWTYNFNLAMNVDIDTVKGLEVLSLYIWSAANIIAILMSIAYLLPKLNKYLDDKF